MYQSFGLSIDSRGVRSITDMVDVELGTEIAKDLGSVAWSAVGHDSSNGDTEALIVGDSRLEQGDCASGGFVGITTEKATRK